MQKIPNKKPFYRDRPLYFHDTLNYKDFLLARKRVYRYLRTLTTGVFDTAHKVYMFKTMKKNENGLISWILYQRSKSGVGC